MMQNSEIDFIPASSLQHCIRLGMDHLRSTSPRNVEFQMEVRGVWGSVRPSDEEAERLWNAMNPGKRHTNDTVGTALCHVFHMAQQELGYRFGARDKPVRTANNQSGDNREIFVALARQAP